MAVSVTEVVFDKLGNRPSCCFAALSCLGASGEGAEVVFNYDDVAWPSLESSGVSSQPCSISSVMSWSLMSASASKREAVGMGSVATLEGDFSGGLLRLVRWVLQSLRRLVTFHSVSIFVMMASALLAYLK